MPLRRSTRPVLTRGLVRLERAWRRRPAQFDYRPRRACWTSPTKVGRRWAACGMAWPRLARARRSPASCSVMPVRAQQEGRPVASRERAEAELRNHFGARYDAQVAARAAWCSERPRNARRSSSSSKGPGWGTVPNSSGSWPRGRRGRGVEGRPPEQASAARCHQMSAPGTAAGLGGCCAGACGVARAVTIHAVIAGISRSFMPCSTCEASKSPLSIESAR